MVEFNKVYHVFPKILGEGLRIPNAFNMKYQSISNQPEENKVDSARQVLNLFWTILNSYFSTHCLLSLSVSPTTLHFFLLPCDISYTLKTYDVIIPTAWKMSIFGVFLVLILPHSDWIQRDTPCLSVFTRNMDQKTSEFGHFSRSVSDSMNGINIDA